MKALIITVLVTGVIGGIVLYPPQTAEYVRESSEEEITTVEVAEVDVIEQSRAELDRINAVLDSEEKLLRDEMASIQAEADAEIATRQARIEEILKVRQGF